MSVSAYLDDIALPSNIESEKYILGACLNDPESLQQAIDTVRLEDFFLGTHQVIYSAMQRLFHAGSDVDRHILATELDQRKQLAAAGNLGYIVSLERPRIANVDTYLRDVRSTAVVRRAIRESQALIERLLCYREDSGEMLDTPQKSGTNPEYY